MKKIHQKQDQYKVFERHGQLVFALNSEITIPQNAPVRLLSAQLEELEYGKLYKAYSPRGRKSAADPRVLFKVMVHGYLCGIYSSRKLEEACQYRIDFRWLLEDQKAPDHTTFARFRTGRCREVVEDLFYQFVKKLEDMSETDHKTVYIDGTKLESAAGRYTFVWRKLIQKHLAKVKAELEKRTGLKSASAIGSMLEEERRHILFVHGSGKRKSPQQREWEEQWTLLERWKAYERKLAIMGESRNSYSKTDPDATFMRMKEDHMRNGQLKPGYNVQIAVNSEYITGLEVFSDRSDAKTFRPMMRKLAEKHGKPYEESVADAGYESLENYLYLAQNGQVCFIKPTNYDQKKTKKFKRQIGRIENMAYCHDDDCFICTQGRKLKLRRETTEQRHGQFANHRMVPLRGLRRLSLPRAMLSGKRPQSAQGSCFAKNLLGKARTGCTQYFIRARHSSASVPLYSEWKARLRWLKTILGFAASSPEAKAIFARSCFSSPWRLTSKSYG